VLRKIKLRQNVLDGADFVRDVIDTYLKVNVRQGRLSGLGPHVVNWGIVPKPQVPLFQLVRPFFYAGTGPIVLPEWIIAFSKESCSRLLMTGGENGDCTETDPA